MICCSQWPKPYNMKYFLLICCLSVLTGTVYAQEKSESERLFPLKPGIILSTSLSTLLEPEAGPSLGLEYRIIKGLAIGVEGTVFLYKMPETYEAHYSTSGFRIRPEIKYFPKWGQGKSMHVYFSLMGLYKQVRYYEYDYYDGQVRKKKTATALSPNVGLQRYLDRSHHFIMDMYMGLGVRHRKTEPGDELLYDNFGRTSPIEIDVDGNNPHVAFGFKLGYRF